MLATHRVVLGRVAAAQVPVLARRVGADDEEGRVARLALVARPGRQDDDARSRAHCKTLATPRVRVPGPQNSRRRGSCTSRCLDPVGDSLLYSTLFAIVPIVALFILLGGLRLAAHVAAVISLALSIIVAVAVYSMPVGQTLDAGLEGAAFGIFPIMWIVWNAIWIFKMTEATGHFAVLRRSLRTHLRRPARPGRDHRVLLRRAARGAGRLRHAGRDHRRSC